MIISVKLAIRCLYNFKDFRHTTICMVFLLKSQAKERSAFNKYRSYVYHESAGDNEGITRSGAGRKGWPCVMIRGWQKRSRSAAYSARKSSVNALFRRGGFTVGTESMCVHRFSRLNNSTIRNRVPKGNSSPFSSTLSLCKATN